VFGFWIERNNRLFSNKENNIPQLLEEVKIHSYWWMKSANAIYVLLLLRPLACLGIG